MAADRPLYGNCANGPGRERVPGLAAVGGRRPRRLRGRGRGRRDPRVQSCRGAGCSDASARTPWAAASVRCWYRPGCRSGHRARFERAVGPRREDLVGRRIEMPAVRGDGTELRVEYVVTQLADSPPVLRRLRPRPHRVPEAARDPSRPNGDAGGGDRAGPHGHVGVGHGAAPDHLVGRDVRDLRGGSSDLRAHPRARCSAAYPRRTGRPWTLRWPASGSSGEMPRTEWRVERPDGSGALGGGHRAARVRDRGAAATLRGDGQGRDRRARHPGRARGRARRVRDAGGMGDLRGGGGGAALANRHRPRLGGGSALDARRARRAAALPTGSGAHPA